MNNLSPLYPTEGNVQERHEADRQLDGVKTIKILTIKFHKFRDIFKFKKEVKDDGKTSL